MNIIRDMRNSNEQPTNQILQSNLSLVRQRWPEVLQSLEQAESPRSVVLFDETPEKSLQIDGILLASAYDRYREASIQAALIPYGSQNAWVYGFGLGDLPRVLLERLELRQLMVIMLNPSEVLESLRVFDHTDWLVDPRVSLLTEESEVWFPFAAVPASLALADGSSARLRDMVHLELSMPYVQEKQSENKERFSERIEGNEDFLLRDSDVAELFGCHNNGSVMVAGAGPSLKNHYELIRERHKKGSPLVAVDAALRPLVAAGIYPDVVVSIDGHADGLHALFQQLDSKSLSQTVLVYSPIIAREVLEFWSGRRFVAWTDSAYYNEFSIRYPRARLFSCGSVIHPAVDLAVKMGGREILLLGADFSFPGNRSHVDGCVLSSTRQQSEVRHWVLNGRGEKVPTIPNLRGYLRDLERYIRQHPEVSFFNGSLEGAAIEGAVYWGDRS